MNRKESKKLLKVRDLRRDSRYREFLKGKQELRRVEKLLDAMQRRERSILRGGEALMKAMRDAMFKRTVTGYELALFDQDRIKRDAELADVRNDITTATRFREQMIERVEELRKIYRQAEKDVDQWKSLDERLVEQELKMEEIKTELNDEPRAARQVLEF
jgi:hypothetical protein